MRRHHQEYQTDAYARLKWRAVRRYAQQAQRGLPLEFFSPDRLGHDYLHDCVRCGATIDHAACPFEEALEVIYDHEQGGWFCAACAKVGAGHECR